MLAATLAVAGAPLSHRAGLLPAGGALGFVAVALLPLVWVLAAGLLRLARGGRAQIDLRTGAGVVLAAGASAIPIATVVLSIGAPPIHDITTDTEDPPRFEAIVEVRGSDSNPLDYQGPELAATQRASYPDIEPLVLAGNPGDLADVALAVGRELGWQVVAVESLGSGDLRQADRNRQRTPEPSRGVLIEATATTLWFGFKDDVAVRLRRAPDVPGATTVDVRSISRVGIGDLGANAARIREFLERLEAAVG